MVMTGDKFGFLWAKGRKSATLRTLWATKAISGGDLQREEGRAAARLFSPPSVILHSIYLAL